MFRSPSCNHHQFKKDARYKVVFELKSKKSCYGTVINNIILFQKLIKYDE